MASTYLTCNVGSPNQQRFTWSLWVKRSKLGVEQHLAGNNVDGNNRTHLFITNTEKLYFFSNLSGSNVISYQTNRLFRDLNAWYHIVCAVDTTQAGGNRIRIYVNGEEETSFATETECNQNTNLSISGTHYIGTYGGSAGSASYSFDGSISHLHFVDGSQLTPSSFGETDSTTGEWKINTSPSVTYGSSGYFILKDGNSVTDQSGNSNNFTVGGGTLTNTEDNPSNVFATLNPLDRAINGTAPTFENGNTKWTSSGNGTSNNGVKGTLGASSGKYYWEVKFNTAAQTVTGMFQINGTTGWDSNGYIANNTGFYGIQNTGIKRVAGVSTTSVFTALSDNDIGMFAYDLDNNKFWFGVNGTWVASGNPASGVNSLGTLASGTYLPIISNVNWSIASSASFNFGNGYFGTTAVASAGTNASGIGIFEYDVPTGYTALSTKGLNL